MLQRFSGYGELLRVTPSRRSSSDASFSTVIITPSNTSSTSMVERLSGSVSSSFDKMRPRYGSRLMPIVVDEIAKAHPDLTYAFSPVTADVNDGFEPVTFSEIANAVNGLATWIETTIGRSSHFETIAYIGLNDLRYVAVFLAGVKCGYKV